MSQTSKGGKYARNFSYGKRRKRSYRSGLGDDDQENVGKPVPPIYPIPPMLDGPRQPTIVQPDKQPQKHQTQCSPNKHGGFSCKNLSTTKPRKKRCQYGC